MSTTGRPTRHVSRWLVFTSLAGTLACNTILGNEDRVLDAPQDAAAPHDGATEAAALVDAGSAPDADTVVDADAASR